MLVVFEMFLSIFFSFVTFILLHGKRQKQLNSILLFFALALKVTMMICQKRGNNRIKGQLHTQPLLKCTGVDIQSEKSVFL